MTRYPRTSEYLMHDVEGFHYMWGDRSVVDREYCSSVCWDWAMFEMRWGCVVSYGVLRLRKDLLSHRRVYFFLHSECTCVRVPLYATTSVALRTETLPRIVLTPSCVEFASVVIGPAGHILASRLCRYSPGAALVQLTSPAYHLRCRPVPH